MKKPFFAVALLGVAMAACTQLPTPSPSSQTNTNSLSVVTLAMNGETAAGLRPAVALLDTAVTIQAPATYTNVVLTNSTDKFIFGTFTITANQSFNNLTLYALAKSTNAGGTALNSVFNAGNAAITSSTDVQKVKPVHRMVTNTSTVDANGADMQYFQVAEAAAIQKQARDTGLIGASDQVLEYGYVARRCTADCASATPTWTRAFGSGDVGQITIGVRLPVGATAANDPYKFNMTFLVADETTMRFTRSIEEGTTAYTNVAARAIAVGGTVATKEVFVRGGPGLSTTTPTICTNCVQIRTDNLRTSSAPTFLVTPTNGAAVSGVVYTPYVTSNNPKSLGIPVNAEFAIGEAIVKYKPVSLSGALRPQTILDGQNLYGNTSLVKAPTIVPHTGAARSALASSSDAQSTLDFIADLRTRPDVEYAQPNYRYKHTLTPNDPKYPVQVPASTPNNVWHYGMANIPTAWDTTTGDSSVVIAILDTGILYNKADYIGLDANNTREPNTHEDLYCGSGAANRWLQGFDFVSYSSGVETNTFDDDDPADLGPVADTGFHGTHVAGTIGACSNNALGIAGINWSSRLMAVRVLGPDGGYTSDITRGMRWAAGLSVTANTGSGNTSITNPNPADVLNMSLGGPGVDQAYQNASDDVANAGKVLVVSAGNDNDDSYNYSPAGQRNVLTVAALGPGVKRAYYSNFGTAVEIAAPGGDLNSSTTPNGVLSTLGCGTNGETLPSDSTGCGALSWGYVEYQGTSMAAPHIAGIVGLMNAARIANSLPKLNLQQATYYLQNTATAIPSGSGCESGCGAGLVNASAAVAAAIANAPIGAFLQLEYDASGANSVPGIDLGASGTTATITLRNLSSTSGTYTLSGSNAFLSAAISGNTTGSILGNETKTVNVTLNRTGLTDGAYLGSIQASTGTQSTFAPVFYRQGGGSVNAGRMLIDLLRFTGSGYALTARQVVKFVPSQGYVFRVNSSITTSSNYAIQAAIDADQNGTSEYYICYPVPVGFGCQNNVAYTFPVTTTAVTQNPTIGVAAFNMGTIRY
jgi:serine protease